MDPRVACGVSGARPAALRTSAHLFSLHARVLRRRLGFTVAYLLFPLFITLSVHLVTASISSHLEVSRGAGISFSGTSSASSDPRVLPEKEDGTVGEFSGYSVDPDGDGMRVSEMRGDGKAARRGHVYYAPLEGQVTEVMKEMAGADPGLDFDTHFTGFGTVEDMVKAAVEARKKSYEDGPVVLISRSPPTQGGTTGRFSVAYYNSSRVYVRPTPPYPFSLSDTSSVSSGSTSRFSLRNLGWPLDVSPSAAQLAYLLGDFGLPGAEREVTVGEPVSRSDLNPCTAAEFSLLVHLLRARVAVVTKGKGLSPIDLRVRVKGAPVRRVPKSINARVGEYRDRSYIYGEDVEDLSLLDTPAETDAKAMVASNVALFLAIAVFTHGLQVVSFGIGHKTSRELGLLRQSGVTDGAYLLSMLWIFLPLSLVSSLVSAAVLASVPLVTFRASYFVLVWLSLFFADAAAIGASLGAVAFFQRSGTSNAFLFAHGLASWLLLMLFSEFEPEYFDESRSHIVLGSHWIVPVLFVLLAPQSLIGAAFSSLTAGARGVMSPSQVISGSRIRLNSYAYRQVYPLIAVWSFQLAALVFHSFLAWYFLGSRAGTSRANGAPRRHWLCCFGVGLGKPSASSPGSSTGSRDGVTGASGYADPVARALADSADQGSIVAREVGKVFPGKTATTALRDVSLTVRSDRVTALLGDNGCGKTTLLSILSGQAPPTSGSIAAFGFDAGSRPDELRSRVGICPQEDTALNEHLTPAEVFYTHATLRGVPADKRPSVVGSLLAAMNLSKPSVRDARIGTLTGGQRRRISIALACIGSPRVCFFDEPGAPLDPRNRRAVYRFLREISKDRGVVFTTHLIEDAEWADDVAILGEARLRAHGSPARLKAMYGAGYTLRIVLGAGVPREVAERAEQSLRRALPSASLLESAFHSPNGNSGSGNGNDDIDGDHHHARGPSPPPLSPVASSSSAAAAAARPAGARLTAASFTFSIPRAAARTHVPAAVAQIAELRAGGHLQVWDLSHATLEQVVVRVAAAGEVNAQAFFETERIRAEEAAAREAVASAGRGQQHGVGAYTGDRDRDRTGQDHEKVAPICKSCGERPTANVKVTTRKGATIWIDGVLCEVCGGSDSDGKSSSSSSSRSSASDDGAGSEISMGTDSFSSRSSSSSSFDDDGAGSDIGGLANAGASPSPSSSQTLPSRTTDRAVTPRELVAPRTMRALAGRTWSRTTKSRKTVCALLFFPLLLYTLLTMLILRDPGRSESGWSPNNVYYRWRGGREALMFLFLTPFSATNSLMTTLRGPDLEWIRSGNIADRTRATPGLAALGRRDFARSVIDGETCDDNALFTSPVRVSIAPSAGGAGALGTTWLRRFWDHSPVSLFGTEALARWDCPVKATGCPECNGLWPEPADPGALLTRDLLLDDVGNANYYRVKTFADVQFSGPGDAFGDDDIDDDAAERRLGSEMLAQQDAAVAARSTSPCASGTEWFASSYPCTDRESFVAPLERALPRLAVRVRKEDPLRGVDFTIVAPIVRTYMPMRNAGGYAYVNDDEWTVSPAALVEDSAYAGFRASLGIDSAAVTQYAYVALLAYLGGHPDPDVRRIYAEQATLPFAKGRYSTRPAEWDTAAEMPPLDSVPATTESPAYASHIAAAADSESGAAALSTASSDGGFSPHVASSWAIGLLLFVLMAMFPTVCGQTASEMEGHVADMIRLAGVTNRSYWVAHHLYWTLFTWATLVPLVTFSYGFDIPPFGPGVDTVFDRSPGVIPLLLVMLYAHAQAGFAAFLAVLLARRQRAVITAVLLVPLTIAFSVVLNLASRGSVPWWTTFFLPQLAFARGVHGVYASADPSADYTALMCSLLLLVEGFVFVTLAAFVSAVRRVSNDAGVDSSEAVATVIGGAFGRVVGALCRAACAPCRPIARCLAPRGPVQFDDATQVGLMGTADTQGLDDDDHSVLAERGPEVQAEADRVWSAVSRYNNDNNNNLTSDGVGAEAMLFAGVSKTFMPSGKKALSNMTIGVRRGEVLCLLGPNGSGKSTIVKILTRTLRPDGDSNGAGDDIEGHPQRKVVVDAVDVLDGAPSDLYARIGVQPQHNAVWDDLTVEENILFYCRVRGVPRRLEKVATLDAAMEVGLSGHEFTKPASTLSGGQKRMLTLAFALVGAPTMVILDEPTAAISVNGRRRAWDVITRATQGRSALVLTHIMEEASALAHRVAIIARGRLVRVGAPLALQNRFCDGFKLSIQPRRKKSGSNNNNSSHSNTGGNAAIENTDGNGNGASHPPPSPEEAVTTIVMLAAPEARAMESSTSRLDYFVPLEKGCAPREASAAVTRVLEAIAPHAADPTGPIEEWSVSQPTLEDVFLRVIGSREDDHH